MMEKMKKCPRCGAIQKASRTNCIDCGEFLGEAHAEFSKELDGNVRDAIDRKMDSDDYSTPLYYIRRAVIIAAVAVCVFDIVLLVLYGGEYNVNLIRISLIVCVLALLVAMFPRFASWLMRSRRFHRTTVTSSEVDYIDSNERIFTLIAATLMLVIGIFTSVYFVSEKPQKQGDLISYETMADGSSVRVEFNR